MINRNTTVTLIMRNTAVVMINRNTTVTMIMRNTAVVLNMRNTTVVLIMRNTAVVLLCVIYKVDYSVTSEKLSMFN